MIETFVREPTGSSSTWTVREALLHALSVLNDEPEISRCVIVLAGVDAETGETVTTLINRAENGFEICGILADALNRATSGN